MEARYSTYIQDRDIFIYFPDPQVFEQLVTNHHSGFAIDLINRSQYACESTAKPHTEVVRGALQKPLFRKDLKARIQQDAYTGLTIKAGRLPDHLREEEVEPNLIYIFKRYPCHYLTIYDLEVSDWELLDTGLFQDYPTASSSFGEDTAAFEKSMRFTIPFEKNRATYQHQDIKILYDSLRLTDYTVTEVRILALTSVEGSQELNEKLQQQRANSLVQALEAYQGTKVKARISTSENWKDFLYDIAGTPYQHYGKLSKTAIKEQLAKPEIASALEGLLSRHRKGLIELSFIKTITFLNESPEAVAQFYSQFVKEQDLEQALALQAIIFERIKNESLPKDFLDQLEVPQHTSFGPLLLRRIAFQYRYINEDEAAALRAFEELSSLMPNNPELGYNIASLRLRLWLQDPEREDSRELYQTITGLRKKGVEQILINRLLLNYYIIEAQQQLFSHNYREKDRYLRLIYNTYASADLGDEDALRLARFLAFYSRFDWARTLLHARVKREDTSEDLIFYYLSLSLTDKGAQRARDWKQIQQKALSLNQARYCMLFATRGHGGVSFQLLDDPILKEEYCRQCEGPN